MILGDQNADPLDGDSYDDAIDQLLDHPRITDPPPDVGGRRRGRGAAGRREPRRTRATRPHDTADFDDNAPGNLRADYVLPSRATCASATPASSGRVQADPLFAR